MLKAQVYRPVSGTIMGIVGEVNVDRATLDQKISNADSASLQYPADLFQMQGADRVVLYDISTGVTGDFVGIFRVVSIEELFDANGVRDSKISLAPEATWLLDNTGTPDDSMTDNLTLVQTAYNIASQVMFMTQQAIEINLVHVDDADAGTINPNRARSNRLIKGSTTQNMLELLSVVVTPSNSRWRCRSDLEMPTLEIGLFGDIKPVSVYLGVPSTIVPDMDKLILADSGQIMVNDQDSINLIFLEGGTWTDDAGRTTPLIPWPKLEIPSAFTLDHTGYPWGMSFFSLKKNTDKNGNPWPIVRSRRIVIGTIVPETSGGMPPSGDQVVAASQALVDAGMDYLNDRSEVTTTATLTVGESTISKFLVGDKVYFNAYNLNGTVRFSGYMFVASRSISWEPNKVSCHLELSTILESLTDPLTREYNKILLPARQTADQGSYSGTVVCSPDGTYAFSDHYSNPPSIANISSVPAAGVGITSLTFESVSFHCSVNCKVSFSIIPRRK